MLKKWPWKKHQTGFLITHLGLITLVASGLLSALAGSSGVLVMVDSAEPQFRKFGLHATDFVIDRDRQALRVLQDGVEIIRDDFEPGPLPWHDSQANSLTRLLGWLAQPLPHDWSRDLPGGARLEVIDYYPHTQEQLFTPTARQGEEAFPAVEFQLGSPTTGLLAPQWVAYHDGRRTLSVGPGLVEFLGQGLRGEQIAEFKKPAADSKMGQLVLGLHGRIHRLDTADSWTNRPGCSANRAGACG